MLVRRLLAVAAALSAFAATAATPPEGVALVVRRGFFTETDIGGFMTVGGEDGYSNLQTYLQLGIGYDVSQTIELGLHAGIGANAQNCWDRKEREECVEADNFTVMFIDLTAAYLFRIAERFYVTPKLVGGYTLMQPAPTFNPPRPKGSQDPNGAIDRGPNAGVGLGVEYATSMDHFSIGFDVMGRYIVGANITSLQFFPRVKYTF
ncbi:MAG: adventurous gliding motility protein CglE [Myxococcales bacterium]|nr:adventurous gliding motility protein CglE [Myxococcales bacterium]